MAEIEHLDRRVRVGSTQELIDANLVEGQLSRRSYRGQGLVKGAGAAAQRVVKRGAGRVQRDDKPFDERGQGGEVTASAQGAVGHEPDSGPLVVTNGAAQLDEVWPDKGLSPRDVVDLYAKRHQLIEDLAVLIEGELALSLMAPGVLQRRIATLASEVAATGGKKKRNARAAWGHDLSFSIA